ncbi:MAG: response regulator [Proteobacteria bacterium]|nr:response regulator [Desulfobacula sp.]MBU4133108.1 response regulator [Pseudomonadota bacterium]
MNTTDSPCIFIADDNPLNLKVLRAMLEANGYAVKSAVDGAQALACIRKTPPDLIILDIHMPKMTGYQVIEALKADPGLKNIPVIFISALSESANKVMGFQKGAVDYIEKPFHGNEVKARVETHLKLQYYQRQLKEQAASSEKRFQLTFENAAVGIAHTRMNGSFFRVNKCLCNILGYTEQEFETLTVQNLTLPEDWEQDLLTIKDLFNDRISTIRREKRYIRKDKRVIWGRVTVSMARDSRNDSKYGIMVVEDITDRIEAEKNRKKMEGQLRQAQRMEAIGTLASGIAHDFNNILGVIMGHTDMAKRKLAKGASAEKNLDAVRTAANRAKDLVKQILTSCRQAAQEKTPIRIDDIVKETLTLLEASLPATIVIKTDIQKCAPILADPTQIHQVIMNLCTNAFHAMEEGGGTLTLGLKHLSRSQDLSVNALSLAPGEYTLLEVSDTGSGINPSLLERIFEPYFTTKPKNKGTGLGLSVVHGIIKSHGGEIFVSSEKETGTHFKVYLPCLNQGPESQIKEADGSPIPGGGETLLIVDDNAPYLEMMTDLLTELGYGVTAIRNPFEALNLIREKPGLFDCLITDYTMPDMKGFQLAQQVRKASPDLPIIMYTGFDETIAKKNSAAMGISAFLAKPVVLSETAATLRAVLGKK